MKAISIRQPWAWAILHAGKRIENRGWSTRHRGPILLHVSAGLTKREYQEFQLFLATLPQEMQKSVPSLPPMAALPRGGIVGRANLVDVLDYTKDTPPSGQAEWFFGPYGFLLDDVREVPFVPYRGELSLFNVPAELAGGPVYG